MILGENKERLVDLIGKINEFLESRLKLKLHSDKIIIRKYHQGIDFLGYVVLPHYRVLRIKTKRRILKKIEKRCLGMQSGLIFEASFNQKLQSYLGVLQHCKGLRIKNKVLSLIGPQCIYSQRNMLK